MPTTSATLDGLFGNWGKRPGTSEMRDHLDNVLQKQRAMAIQLAECQLESERVLQREPAAVAVAAKPGAKGKFKYRPEFKYFTLRGREEESVIIAVRDEHGCALEMLDLERRDEGLTKEKREAGNEALHSLAA